MTCLLFISTLITSYLYFATGHNCTTPDGVGGTCLELETCLPLADMLQSNPTQATFQYVTRSRCEGREQNNVCCPQQLDSIPAPLARWGGLQKCQPTAIPPEPSTGCCGVDASGGGNRIVGGSVTTVDEYPWLALIEYMQDNTIRLLCGGVLISGEYVLTAGHCIAGEILRVAKPIKVRLGEYNTTNSGIDCVEVEGGGQDCTDGPISVRIQKIIPHPDYKPTSKLRRHDIGLIRIAQIVQFTDFIRPICLPTADFTTAPPGNVTLYVSGWGTINDEEILSNIKLKVGLPYWSYKDCQSFYKVSGRRVKLWEGQMCAGGERGKDSCRGDSGGPLMRENGRLFELVGIVSFGPSPCGMENVAGVYTKVFHYLPWIRSQIVA